MTWIAVYPGDGPDGLQHTAFPSWEPHKLDGKVGTFLLDHSTEMMPGRRCLEDDQHDQERAMDKYERLQGDL